MRKHLDSKSFRMKVQRPENGVGNRVTEADVNNSNRNHSIENCRRTLEIISSIMIFQIRKLSLRNQVASPVLLQWLCTPLPPPTQDIFASLHRSIELTSRAGGGFAVWPPPLGRELFLDDPFCVPETESVVRKPWPWLFCCSFGFGSPNLPQFLLCSRPHSESLGPVWCLAHGGPSHLTCEHLNGWRTPVPAAGTPGTRGGL